MKYLFGNWKMNGSLSLLMQMEKLFASIKKQDDYESCLFLPYPYLGCLASKKNNFSIGAQSCSEHLSGAFTGEVSCEILKDVGCKYVLVGHSERRSYQNETNAQIEKKFHVVLNYGMIPVLCIGESGPHKEKGLTFSVIEEQLQFIKKWIKEKNGECEKFVIAYEPVWSIGSGLAANPNDILEVISHISYFLPSVSLDILYGGSVSAANAHEFLQHESINGLLVGKASLDVDFWHKVIIPDV